MNVFLFALGLLAVTTTAPERIGGTPAAIGAPKFVQIVSVTGLPADSTMRGEFMDAFRGVFAENALQSEHGGDGGWQASLALPNRFRLLEGSPADDAWTLDVVVGAPVPAKTPPKIHPRPGEPRRRTDLARRGSRGMIVSFTTQSPEGIRNSVSPAETGFAFAFPAPPPPPDASIPVSSGGYKYSWAAAGKAAGVLALEALHHDSGDLRADERFDIAPVVRIDSGR